MTEIKRKCAGCGQLKNRDDMIKITCQSSDGQVILNPNSKIFGRSVYLCYNNLCIKGALKKNRLDKLLKTSIPESTKGKLINID